jgi:hypothetical protein
MRRGVEMKAARETAGAASGEKERAVVEAERSTMGESTRIQRFAVGWGG